ncbi:hypothetical protein C0J52_15719 [Blattella germanica]|nr:hypothetical protein C0J52_15719 [Blattella germanica]
MASKMQAVQFDLRQKKISLVEVNIPSSTDRLDVVVKVQYAGVCGTDLHIVEGAFPCNSSPFILGHEFCGIVSFVGSDVKHVRPGDNVVVDPESGCETCNYCHGGNYQHCKNGGLNNAVGMYRNGGWAQYCRVPAAQVYKLPSNIPLDQDTGFDIVTPQELKKYRSKDEDWGVDLVIDCSGYAPAMEEALKYVNPGGKLCIFGVSSPTATMQVSPYDIFKYELSIIGININPFSFPKALNWIQVMGERYLSFEKLGIKTFSLDQYEDALQSLKKGIIAKAVFKIDHN